MDSELTKLFNAFAFIFGPALVCTLMAGIMVVTWLLIAAVEWLIDGFRMGAALNRPAVLSPVNAVAADAVIRERERQDKLRRERLRSLKFGNDGPATQTTQSSLTGLPARLKYLDDTKEMDITDEAFGQDEPTYMICSDPLGQPLFFHSILRGRQVESGIRPPKFSYTRLRSQARKMTIQEAKGLITLLPNARNLFIVQEDIKKIELQALVTKDFSPAILDAT